MNCIIKNKNNAYFDKHLFGNQNHWVFKNEAKLFDTVFEAKQVIRKYKLKNAEIEKIKS